MRHMRLFAIVAAMMLLTMQTPTAQTPATPVLDALLKELASLRGAIPAPPPVSPGSTLVPAGANLQAALDAAAPGATLLLAQGATYPVNLVLRNTAGAGTITIRTAGLDDTVLPPGVRITPFLPDGVTPDQRVAKMAKLVCGDCLKPTLTAAAGAHDVAIIAVEFLGNVPHPDRSLIMFGLNPATDTFYPSFAEQPQRITLDRVYLHADPATGGRQGVLLDGRNLSVINSDIRGFWLVGQDAQAVGCIQAQGPLLIQNNYLEASGENFLCGGADPTIAGAIPSDITFRGNYVYKPPSWKAAHPGSVKNLFELKNARRVLIDGNVFENVWVDGQAGHAIVFTVRNQDGACPWCTVDHVTFTNNVVKNVAGNAFNLLGTDDSQVSAVASTLTIVNNLLLNVQRGAQIAVPITGLELGHNTFVGIGNNFLSFGAARLPLVKGTGLNVHDNVASGGLYGVTGDNTGSGTVALDAFATGWLFKNNVIEGNVERVIAYPATTTTLAPGTLAGKLDARMRYLGTEAGSDGTKPGADVDAILRLIPWLAWP